MASGVIAAETDTDVYRVDVSAEGNYTATASAAALGGNLDIKLDTPVVDHPVAV
jgi:hypothetical protein